MFLFSHFHASAAEFFVSKEGLDANNGMSRAAAFQTIQKGVDALTPGDTLTIGPGEYFESVTRDGLGNADVDTVIRAEVPGTAILRGDIPAPKFTKVEGYRFVYAAPLAEEPKAVLEHNKLRTLQSKANIPELEFAPGFFHYDAGSKMLYLSNEDLSSPEECRYTLAMSGTSGLSLQTPTRVTIDGLAATGFYPGWGILLAQPVSCTVRNCVSFMNVGGIVLQPIEGVGKGDGGSNNVVENCVTYGNSFGGIVRYGANNDVIRNCHTYLNVTEGKEHFGIMHYAGMTGPLLLQDNISWGQSFDYSVKAGNQQEKLERNVGLGFIRIATEKMSHDLFGGGNEYGRGGDSTAPADTILFAREKDLDKDVEFADPLNLDYRLQPDSRFRGTAPDGSDRGPYQYKENIFYVSPAGNDEADGLSTRKPWRTLERAFKKLRPGDTLYLSEGKYAAAPLNKVGDGKAPIQILGRGRGTVVITGKQTVTGGAGIVFERLNFAGGISLAGSRSVTFKNCTFFGGGDGLAVEKVEDLKVTHSVFTNASLRATKSKGLTLSGNIYANEGHPSVRLDTADAIRYSDYNGYEDTTKCWDVNGETWSFADLQKRHDIYSQVVTPKLTVEKDVPMVASVASLKSTGPGSTALGIYHAYDVTPRTSDLIGPFLHSVSDTTANIEWWTSHPGKYSLAWGTTEAMENKVEGIIGTGRFNTYSLTGLEPGQTYYFKIVSADARKADETLAVLTPEDTPLKFATAAVAAEPRTYYVAPNGKDSNDGLGGDQAFRTINHAAALVGPGDTVLIAGGDYPETVRVRAAGTQERPITFRGVTGEKPALQLENLPRSFELISKPDNHFDGLYFRGQDMWRDGFLVNQSPRVQITRCMDAMVAADSSPGLLIRNCVIGGGWSAIGISRSPGSIVENNVIASTILRDISAEGTVTVRRNIFLECIRNKMHQTLLELSDGVAESDNCFYLFWPENQKLAVNDLPLSIYKIQAGSNSFGANPMLPGAPGWTQGWSGVSREDFDQFFSMNPQLILRDIGLQPEAFKDFKFKTTEWPYDRAWAEKFVAAETKAQALVQGGKDAEALTAYANIVAQLPLSDRLKSDVLQKASLCAERMKDYTQAMQLAKDIPVEVLSMHRQMQLMVEQKNYQGLLAAFNSKALGGRAFLQSFTYPEHEDVMADLYYYRALAYIQAGDLAAAEVDLRVMNYEHQGLGYTSGVSINELTSLRLGDFYRTQLKDDAKALEQYLAVCDRNMWLPHGTVVKPVLTGASETLVKATQAATEILTKQGKLDQVKELQQNLAQAQAEAFAFRNERKEMLAKLSEVVAAGQTHTAVMDQYAAQIGTLPEDTAKTLLEAVANSTTPLSETARKRLLESAADPQTKTQAIAILVAFAPTENTGALLEKNRNEVEKQAVLEKVKPVLAKMGALVEAKKWDDLVSEFSATKFEDWGDPDLAAKGFLLRAQAHVALNEPGLAQSDLENSLRLNPDSPEALTVQAENYLSNFKDPEKALAAYQRAHEIVGINYGWMSCDRALKISALLEEQGRRDEALAILTSYDLKKVAGSWNEKFVTRIQSLGQL